VRQLDLLRPTLPRALGERGPRPYLVGEEQGVQDEPVPGPLGSPRGSPCRA
jgi:hypothetical protein